MSRLRRSPVGFRILTMVSLFMLVMSLAGPLLPTASADTLAGESSQNEQIANDAPNPLQVNDELSTPSSDEPTEEPGVVPTDEATSEPTDDSTLREAGPTSGTISVTFHYCPEDVDISDPQALTLGNPCTENGFGDTVYLFASDGSSVQQSTSGISGETVIWTDMPFDDYVMMLQNVDGLQNTVDCFVNTTQSNTRPYQANNAALMASDGASVDTRDEGIDAQCNWFIRVPSTGNLTVTKWNCPAGFDVEGSTREERTVTCLDEVGDPVHFRLQGPEGYDSTTATDPMIGDIAHLNSMPEGTYQMTELVPDGYQLRLVECSLIDGSGMVYGPATDGMITNGATVSVEISRGLYTACDVFDAPARTDGVTVHIEKFLCPPGYTSDGMPGDWATDCADDPGQVAFVITDASGPHSVVTDDQDQITVSGMQMIDGDSLEIREEPQAGFDTPVVMCDIRTPDRTDSGDMYRDMLVTDGSVTFADLDPAVHEINCFWFNIPTGHGSTITIHKWECPDFPEGLVEEGWWETNCTTPVDGVPFYLVDGNDPRSLETEGGVGTFENVATGEVEIQEVIPEQYRDTIVVLCTITYGSDTPSPLEITGDAQFRGFTIPDDGAQIDCNWYNFPHESPSITIHKYACPPDSSGDGMYGSYVSDCTEPVGDVTFTLTGEGSLDAVTGPDGIATFDPVHFPSGGMVSIQETIPDGYGVPVVFCSDGRDFETYQMDVIDGTITVYQGRGVTHIECTWFNMPHNPGTVTIYKWECPEYPQGLVDSEWYLDNCTTPMDDIEFTVSDANGVRSDLTAGGVVEFNDVSDGSVSVTETIPSGYAANVVVHCTIQYGDGVAEEMPGWPVNATWNMNIEFPGANIVCNWYNFDLGPGEITIYKYTCPPGYDRNAHGADPMTDCTELTNGVTFVLDGMQTGYHSQSDTGDSINGAVYFGSLESDTYTISELIPLAMPMADVFVWNCYGLNTSSVHPQPLNVGTDLTFTITGGDHIECYWFNVPPDPYGSMVITKYNCTTQTYVRDVDCYRNRGGQKFELQMWTGTAWVKVADGTTDANGQISFTNLEPGDYKLVEPGTQACLIRSSNITQQKNVGVVNGEQTQVNVFNCKQPTPPQETPRKYPNTGAGPAETDGNEQRLPGIEGLAPLGLVMVAGMNRRRLLKGALGALGLTASTLVAHDVAAQDIVPMDATPPPGPAGTPAAADCVYPATPAVAATPAAMCARGAVPVKIQIPAISVDATIEYLEIVDGAIQPPTGATDVAWYRETSRLGEIGNGLYAGHLNWWGVPEGVFFKLETLAQGDQVQITGDDDKMYIYAVDWAENFPSDEEPPDDALGVTDEEAITLITCGGEWVSERSEYDHRTLVRAYRQVTE